MKVIIIGGGVAGLTFANALEQAGIDFVLLEARAVFDPQVGASIGLGPGALRIYDQFGAAKEIIDQTTPLCRAISHDRDGKPILPKYPVLELLQPRLGYGLVFLDRQLVLRAAARSVKRRDRLLVNKRLASVDHFDSGVTVHCDDGSSYSGDMVVGCDGVRSKLRSEMWRIAAAEDPGYFSTEEKTKLGAEFTCLFGISQHVCAFDEEGCLYQTYDKGSAFLLVVGKDGRLYWFFYQKLDKVYKVTDPDFPKYTAKDAEEVAERNKHRRCHEWATLGDVWEKRVSYTLVPMEEALFDKWSWRRMATVGDNSHKMTANHGQAGNNAIESAAALANQLKRLHDAGTPDMASIERAFQLWRDKRRARVEATYKEAAVVCRMQSLENLRAYVFEFWAVPLMRDVLINMMTDTVRGAELLEFLPVPDRSLTGSMPFNQYQGIGNQESLISRALKASPLLLVSAYVASQTGGQSLDRHMWHLVQPATASNAQWYSSFLWVTNQATLSSIWLIESHRRCNRVAPARLACLFGGLASLFGLGVVAPVWFFFHYLSSAVENFAAADMRLTSRAYTTTIVPIHLAFLAVPLALKSLVMGIPLSPELWRWMSVFSLLSIALIQTLLVSTGVIKDTAQRDAAKNPLVDLPTLGISLSAMSVTTVFAWALSAFVTYGEETGSEDTLLRLNRIGTSLSSLLWLGLLFLDLYQAGMAELNVLYVATTGVCIAAGVPSPAVVAIAFAMREQILATKRERHSITKEKYSGKSVLEVDREATAQPESAKHEGSVAANGNAMAM